MKPRPVIAEWSLKDCRTLVRELFAQLEDISSAAGRQVAMFVDEYDKQCVSALDDPVNFLELNKVMESFYSLLKGRAFIPFLFVTGSSRLAIKGFFSGANDITDLSYDASATTALGYSWKDIKELYSTQLGLVMELYGLNEDQLKAKMELW
jgi:hypothetical protein